MVLSGAGHAVTTAENGEEGLAKAQASSFDLVITDIIMPKVDGTDVLMAIKDGNAATPVIAISGGAASISPDHALMIASERADEVLPKPFSRTDLFNAVDRLIDSEKPSN